VSRPSPFADAERTAWLEGRRVSAYNPTLALLALLVVTVAAIPVVLADTLRLWPIALLLLGAGFGGVIALRRRTVRGVRLNNGGVALMMRGEDLGATTSFRAVVRGFHGRDVVGMSLHNLGVLALRALDLPSAIALQRAAVAVGRGFRFRPSIPTELARVQLAFVLAAGGRDDELAEADAMLEASKDALTPQAIAFVARARAMLAARRGRWADVVDALDAERALLRNVLPLNDAVLCEAMESWALGRLGESYRGAARVAHRVLADEAARAYVKRLLPAAESVLVS
jgi:hypothetical protein